MDVSVSELRAHLSTWIDRARAGEEVVVTERGRPVARLVAPDEDALVARLEAQGVLGRPTAPKRSSREFRKVRGKGSAQLSDIVSELRGNG